MNIGAETIKQNLTKLKQIWISKGSVHVIKETIWSFKNKLPMQYQQSILMFCSTQNQTFNNKFSTARSVYLPNSHALVAACRIFKGLDSGNSALKKIQNFQYFLQTQKDLTQQQIDICKYSLSCLYESINMEAKAQKILSEVKGMKKLVCGLKAKINLKFKIIRGIEKQVQKQQEIIINRFTKFTNIILYKDFIKKLGKCKLNEMFNMGLCFKKSVKYSLAIKIFDMIINESQAQLKISVLSKINKAQCQYQLGATEKAIKTLTQLVQSQIFLVQAYKRQIEAKINIWNRSIQILQFASNLNATLFDDVKGMLIGLKVGHHRNLFNSKNLTVIQEKQQELKKLLGSNQIIFSKQKSKHFQKLSLPYRLFTHKKAKLSLKSLLSTKQSDVSNKRKQELNKKNTENKKLNKISSINRYIKQDQQQNQRMSEYSEKSKDSCADGRWANNQLINHYWTIIKNSQDQGQIAQIYLTLGDTYVKDNDYENAQQVYKKALDKGRYEAYGRLGNLFYHNNKNLIAAQYYEKYLKYVDSSDHNIQMRLLHCYSKLPQFFKKANQKLKQILQSNPYNTEAHVLYTTVLMKQNHSTKAIQQCQQFKKLKFTCFQNHHLLGLLYKNTGKISEAHESFISALRINPCHVNSLFELIEIADIQNFIPEIIKIYKKALEFNKQNHEIIQILLHLISRQKIDFETIKPRLNFSELISIGDFFLEKQMIIQAEYAYKQASEYTNNTLLKEKLGDLEYAKKNYQKAEEYFRQSQSRKPIFKIQIKLSDTLIKQRKLIEAKEILSDCLTKESESKSICLNLLGQCQYELGNFQEALEKFKLSMSLGYNRKINQIWERTCHKKIMENMRSQAFVVQN